MDAETKTCSKCGEVKPVDAFGRHHWCKSCTTAYSKGYREANTEQVREKNRMCKKSWREANPEEERTRAKSYREANLEKEHARAKAYRESNQEKERTRRKTKYNANKEKIKSQNKSWRDANPEKYAQGVANLSCGYVKRLITQRTPIKEVPQSLIDLKRVQVQITRKLKELKKCK